MAQQLNAISANFTRPSDTTAYASGDLVANSTTAGSVQLLNFTMPSTNFKLQRVGIVHTAITTTNATFRLHLYTTGPTVANGDNGAWSTTQAGYLADVDIDCSIRAFTDNGQGFGLANSAGESIDLVIPAGLIIYGLLEARGAYTPASAEVFTVTLYGESY